MPGVGCLMLDARCLMSGVWCRVFDVGCWMTDIGCLKVGQYATKGVVRIRISIENQFLKRLAF